jgi:hypothetical protein
MAQAKWGALQQLVVEAIEPQRVVDLAIEPLF